MADTRTVDILDATGGRAGTAELPGDVFDVQTNVPLIHQVVVAQLAAARQGTASTKTRGDVSGGGRKPYRQKGTGRARQGSTRAPQFAGGGTVHGPTPRDYAQRTPKKMKAAALRGALSDRARAGRVHVLQQLVTGDVPATRSAVAALAAVTPAERVLVVVERADTVAWKSLRNVPSVHVIDPGQLNTYDVLVNDEVVFTASALETFLARSRAGEPVAGSEPTAPAAPADTTPSPATPAAPAAEEAPTVDATPAPTTTAAPVAPVATPADEQVTTERPAPARRRAATTPATVEETEETP
jgi:large subunit ribosomal protein L4